MIKKKHSKNNKAKYETEKMANVLQHCLKNSFSVPVLSKPNQEAKSPIIYVIQILILCSILLKDYNFRMITAK